MKTFVARCALILLCAVSRWSGVHPTQAAVTISIPQPCKLQWQRGWANGALGGNRTCYGSEKS